MDISKHTIFSSTTPAVSYEEGIGKQLLLTREEKSDSAFYVVEFRIIDADTSGVIGDNKDDEFVYSRKVGPTPSEQDVGRFSIGHNSVGVTLPISGERNTNWFTNA